MQSALKLRTRVLSGKRIEICAPELIEGEDVEVIILPPEDVIETARKTQFKDAWEFLQSIKPVERTPEEWAQIEREFYEERNSWGD